MAQWPSAAGAIAQNLQDVLVRGKWISLLQPHNVILSEERAQRLRGVFQLLAHAIVIAHLEAVSRELEHIAQARAQIAKGLPLVHLYLLPNGMGTMRNIHERNERKKGQRSTTPVLQKMGKHGGGN